MITTPEHATEYIKCAAIRYQLRCDVASNDYRYVSGISHAACIEAFSDLGYRAIDRVLESETQGFMTTADRFVTREEAYHIAEDAGQLSQSVYHKRLFSENCRFGPLPPNFMAEEKPISDNSALIKQLRSSATWLENHGRCVNGAIKCICSDAAAALEQTDARLAVLMKDIECARGSCSIYKHQGACGNPIEDYCNGDRWEYRGPLLNDNNKTKGEIIMRTLDTIQTENNLNSVHAVDEPGPGGANHAYLIKAVSSDAKIGPCWAIQFQCGPRKDPTSTPGVLDGDLLEIVRDRLTAFQNGPFACDENATALEHVTAALNAMNDRAIKRASRGVLGTNKV